MPLRTTVRAMFDLMYTAKGIGLAANQVALPFRFFILNLTADQEQKDQEKVFINPEIVKRHAMVEEEEGCLSLPGLYAKVKRARRIRVRSYDLEGNLVEHDADELFSRAVQHETDHLDGKLFIDYLDPMALRSAEEKIHMFEQALSPGAAERRNPPGRGSHEAAPRDHASDTPMPRSGATARPDDAEPCSTDSRRQGDIVHDLDSF